MLQAHDLITLSVGAGVNMPVFDGQLLNLDVVLTVAGIKVRVQGTVEIFAIRKRMEDEKG
jgi:hypothetical protein